MIKQATEAGNAQVKSFFQTICRPAKRLYGLKWLAVVGGLLVGQVGLVWPALADAPFEGANIISANAGDARSLGAVDLDGDGDIDVIAGPRANTVSWYENDGAQNFTERVVSTNVSNIAAIHAADVDGDGDLDLLAASRGSLLTDGQVAWYENDGSQSFTRRLIPTTIVAPLAVYAADVDGDGDLDILAASRGGLVTAGRVAWYENDGSQTFTERIIATTNLIIAASLYTADVDGDGDIDLLAALAFPNLSEIIWYENDGGQTFIKRLISNNANGAAAVYAIDVDSDGDIDALSASFNDDKIAWYENDGSQNFGEQVISTKADFAVSVYAADVDGDGDVDALSASSNDDKIAWYENDGSQIFSEQVISTNAAGIDSVYAVDIDSDGDIDILAAPFDGDRIAWYENRTIHRSAVFPRQRIVSSAAISATSLYPTDVDRDGDLDLLATSARDNTVAWHENDGSQDFTEQLISTTAISAASVYAADFNRDGAVDVVSASAADNKIAWYKNDNNQNFSEQVISTAAVSATSVYAADVDSDGDPDVLSASAFGNKIAWYENENDGQSFTEQRIAPLDFNSLGIISVYAADVDRDGDTDVLSALADGVAWYENDGSQNFTKRDVYKTNADLGIASVYTADVDGDGDTDILSAFALSNVSMIFWHENDGSQNFSDRLISNRASGAVSVYAADMDGDGDTDVLSAAINDDTVLWYENDGNQNFTDRIVSTEADMVTFVYAADLDDDGDTDVLSTSGGDDKIAWYENRGGQFALATTDTAPASFVNSQQGDLLRITMTHRGRSGDNDAALATLRVLFEETAGDPLTTAEAQALFANLKIFRDDGSGSFELISDTLVTTIPAANLNLVNGELAVIFDPGEANTRVAFGEPAVFFPVVELQADAFAQSPDQFRLTHIVAGSNRSSAHHRLVGLPLSLEFTQNVTSSLVRITSVLSPSPSPTPTPSPTPPGQSPKTRAYLPLILKPIVPFVEP